MSRKVIFKTFRTYRNPYLYDRHTNSLISLSEDEYQEVRRVESGDLAEIESKVIAKYQEQGLLIPNVVEEIEHPYTAVIEHCAKNRMRQLILQVTQQCNLRCEYCQFSGNFYSGYREHGNKRMTWETAKEAIDFFLERSRETSDIVISFYGGEPLLEFDLIRQCAEYVKSKIEGQRVSFSMTTNGTLLSGRIMDYLVANDFRVSISLDGPKENHDLSRKFANGEGSFDLITENINEIRAEYPEYAHRISLISTISPKADLGRTMEFFAQEEAYIGLNITYNPINDVSLSQDVAYSQDYNRVVYYEHLKMLFSLVEKFAVEKVSPVVSRVRTEIIKRKRNMNGSVLPTRVHHSGSCMIGVNRLFFNIEGKMYPCERINEQVGYHNVGTLGAGLNVAQMRKILNIGKLTRDECVDCWNLRHCSYCIAELNIAVEPVREDLLTKCARNNIVSLSNLYEIAVLNELGFNTDEIR